MIKTNNIKRIPNIKERIYLLCYIKPMNITELENEIYQNKNVSVSWIQQIIPEMVKAKILMPLLRPRQEGKNKQQYILKSRIEINSKKIIENTYSIIQRDNERVYQRKYYLTSTGIVLSRIQHILKKNNDSFTIAEIEKIFVIMNSKEFRESLKEVVKDELQEKNGNINRPWDIIIRHLCSICMFIAFCHMIFPDEKQFKKEFLSKLIKPSHSNYVNNIKNIQSKTKELNTIFDSVDFKDIIHHKNEVLLIANTFDDKLLRKILKLDPSFEQTEKLTRVMIDLGLNSK